MKTFLKLAVTLLLSAVAFCQAPPPPVGYVTPQVWAAMSPNGTFADTNVDSSGNLQVTGGSGHLFQIAGYVQPIAPVALNAAGQWVFLLVDGSGNLKTTGSGGGGSGVTITTVSGLNSISGKTKGTLAVVTDGTTATDCTTG